MRMVPCLAVFAAACGGGVSVLGEIDGDEPELKYAYFVQEDEFFAGGDGLMIIVMSGVSDACEVNEALEDELEDADDAGDMEQVWEDYMPEDFWVSYLYMRVGDPGDDLSDTTLEGVGWDDGLDKDDQVYADFAHYTDFLDEEFFSGQYNDYEDYFKYWISDGGDLEISSHKPDEKIKGHLITEAAQPDDGDNDGDIEILFSAERCKPMERYIFED